MFIVQLRLCFGFQPVQFATKVGKILYAASYLRGAAAEWFAGYLENYLDNLTTPDKQSNDIKIIFASFDSFKEAITKIYRDPD